MYWLLAVTDTSVFDRNMCFTLDMLPLSYCRFLTFLLVDEITDILNEMSV